MTVQYFEKGFEMVHEEINRDSGQNQPVQSETRNCPFCGEPIRKQAVKCRFCGEFLNTPRAKKLQELLQQPQDIETESGHKPDEVLFSTSPSILGMTGTFIRSAIIFILAIMLIVYKIENSGLIKLSEQQAVTFARYRVIAGFTLAALTVLVLFIKIIRLKSIYYEVTPRRIEHSRGILIRKVDNLDMFRVEDIRLRRNLFDYFFGIGTVSLLTSDKSDPNFTFEKIHRPKILYKCIKNASLQADSRDGVVHLE